MRCQPHQPDQETGREIDLLQLAFCQFDERLVTPAKDALNQLHHMPLRSESQ